MSIPEYFSVAKEGMRLGSDTNYYSSFNLTQNWQYIRALEAYSDVSNFKYTDQRDNYNLTEIFYGDNIPYIEYTRVAIGDIKNPGTLGVNISSGFAGLYHEVFIDPSAEGIADFALGSTAYVTLMHELGHTIIGPHINGTPQQTIMGVYAINSSSVWHASTLMPLDIDRAIDLYGAATNTRVGDTNYGFNQFNRIIDGVEHRDVSYSTVPAYDFDYNKRPLVTIYDNGGRDQLDASGFLDGAGNPLGVILDLRPGSESKVIGGQTFAVIYKTAMIEDGIGGPSGDFIYGNSADNTLRGGSGNDVITGYGGNDTIFGGDGYDVAVYNGPRSAFNITNLSDGNFVVNHITSQIPAGSPNEGYDKLSGIEEIKFVDTRISTASVGSQQVSTVESNFYGGAHDDVYGVTHSGDMVVENVDGGFDTVYASVNYTLSSNVEALILTGSVDVNGTGNNGANVLIGNSGHNLLTGLAGDDIYGVDGNGDTVVEAPKGGYDEIYSSGNYTMPDNTETLFLTGSSVYATGNSNNNALIGNDLDNIIDASDGLFEFINGGAGNDLLIGGPGHDEIFGGAGNDLFRFTSLADAFNGSSNVGDFLYDFTPGQDHIQFNAAAFGINGAIEGANFVNGAYPTTAAPTLLYTQENGRLFYDADGTGAQNPVILAVLNGTPTLHASDFTFY